MGTDCPPEHNVCHSYAWEMRERSPQSPVGSLRHFSMQAQQKPVKDIVSEGAVPNCDPELLGSKPMLVLNCCIMIIIISSPQMPQ